MGNKSNSGNVLRFQLYVAQESHPDLYEVLDKAGRYHKSKRFLQLALVGLTIENGTVVVNSATGKPPNPDGKNSSKQRKAGGKSTPVAHYYIPDSAAADIDGMFDALS